MRAISLLTVTGNAQRGSDGLHGRLGSSGHESFRGPATRETSDPGATPARRAREIVGCRMSVRRSHGRHTLRVIDYPTVRIDPSAIRAADPLVPVPGRAYVHAHRTGGLTTRAAGLAQPEELVTPRMRRHARLACDPGTPRWLHLRIPFRPSSAAAAMTEPSGSRTTKNSSFCWLHVVPAGSRVPR
jgi:hypothetical protein